MYYTASNLYVCWLTGFGSVSWHKGTIWDDSRGIYRSRKRIGHQIRKKYPLELQVCSFYILNTKNPYYTFLCFITPSFNMCLYFWLGGFTRLMTTTLPLHSRTGPKPTNRSTQRLWTFPLPWPSLANTRKPEIYSNPLYPSALMFGTPRIQDFPL